MITRENLGTEPLSDEELKLVIEEEMEAYKVAVELGRNHINNLPLMANKNKQQRVLIMMYTTAMMQSIMFNLPPYTVEDELKPDLFKSFGHNMERIITIVDNILVGKMKEAGLRN